MLKLTLHVNAFVYFNFEDIPKPRGATYLFFYHAEKGDWHLGDVQPIARLLRRLLFLAWIPPLHDGN